MKFAINPPNTPLVYKDLTITTEWYRYFVQQRRQGDDVTDSDILTLGPAQNIYPNSRELTVTTGELTRALDGSALTLGLADVGTAGDAGDDSKTLKITVDAKGRVTATVEYELNSDNITEGLVNLFFTATRARASISGTVDHIIYDATTGVIDLAVVPGVAGTYASPTSITVDAFGRITAIS